MKQLTITAIIILVVGYPCSAMDNSYVNSPMGSPTAVPSAGRSGLIPNPSSTTTYGAEGNAVVSGNIGGGRQFRGVVPYGSSFYNASSSSPIDNFLRRSADSSTMDRNPGIYDPYYDPQRTVTSINRGGQSGLAAPQLNPQGRVTPYLPQTQNTSLGLQRPLSAQPEDLARILERQMKQIQADDLLKAKVDLNALAKEATQNDSTDLLKPKTPPLSQEKTEDKPGEKEIQPNRYEQIRIRMQEDELKQKETETAQKKTAETKQESPQTKEADGSAAVSDPKSKYKTFTSLAEAKALEYITAAQQFLKEGKFYKAVDSFALAAVWQPENAAAHIGQVGALFAAGEYMSSAYYLNQELTVRPELAGQKIAPAVLMPDRDIFENRLLEIATWQEQSRSGELAFLMAYMFWQDDKVSKAQDMIAKAQTLLPQDPAVKTLAQVISPAVSKPAIPVAKDMVKEPNQLLRTAADVVKKTAVEPNQP
jgi:hypothetical protein